MAKKGQAGNLEKLKKAYPGKFAAGDTIFSHIRPGSRIFVSTGCGEPQHLVNALVDHVKAHPKAFFDAEVLHVWTLGVAPYTEQRFKSNFRHNSFFIAGNSRDAVNEGTADYTPVFLSQVPDLLRRKLVHVDVALVQTSPPDEHGYLSLGVSVDIVKAAVESASLVVAQVNRHMPRVHGDTYLHASQVDYIVAHDEPLLEYENAVQDDVARRIGKYVARIVHDGDTIQVGYGSVPNAILASLQDRNHLGVHTELLSDGIVELMKRGVIDNSRKTVDRGKTVASFCMGCRETYEFLNDNPGIEFRQIDYTNNPLIIARNANMTAINSALEVDLTGQATAESLGRTFYSGIGGSADFMRGAILSPGGKTIIALQSVARDEEVSRIVPFLPEGAGVTIGRGDVHYVVTEYGIAYLHGKNIRERAMDLIAIAHPKFRPWLLEEAKKGNLVYRDQKFVPGESGEYPESFEASRKTSGGIDILLRPVRISDEPLLKDFFYSLSDNSLFRRFISRRKDMPHERLQDFIAIDYTREMVILAVLGTEDQEEVVGIGQYAINEGMHTAEVALVVRDDYQNRGIGTELLSHLTSLAKRRGLLGFTAEVLPENTAMMHLFEKRGFAIERMVQEGTCELKMRFRDS